MKKIIMMLATCLAFSCYADELTTFYAAARAIENGKIPNFVIDLENCTTDGQIPADTLAVVRPDAAMIVEGGSQITATHRHFTLDQPAMRGIPTFVNSKYRIEKYGKATIKVTLMKAQDFTKVAEIEISCQFGSGLRLFV